MEKTENIYLSVNNIINKLEQAELKPPATMLTHRMTKIAWTSQDELFEELLKVFSLIQHDYEASLSSSLLLDIMSVKKLILGTLKKNRLASSIADLETGS